MDGKVEQIKKNKQILLLFVIAGVAIAVLFYLAFISPPGGGIFNDDIEIDEETLKIDYSKINTVVPGQDTQEDVLKKLGEPDSQNIVGEKMHLYYPTPFEDEKNLVVVSGDVVEYAMENVYGEYRGAPEDYIKNLGEPTLVLYQHEWGYGPLSVFLNKGVMVGAKGDNVNAIFYFVPQDQDSFFTGVGADLGLSPENLEDEGHLVGPGDGWEEL